MLAILELPAVRHRAVPISVESYHQMTARGEVSRRTELIRGVILEKVSVSPRHEYLVSELYELTRAAVGPEFYVRKEAALTLVDSEPEPDLAVVVGSRTDYRSHHPNTALLVIELAITSEDLDREKAALYAEAGVEEHWIVLAERGLIEVYTTPRDGLYHRKHTHRPGETAESTALPGLRVDVAALFGQTVKG